MGVGLKLFIGKRGVTIDANKYRVEGFTGMSTKRTRFVVEGKKTPKSEWELLNAFYTSSASPEMRCSFVDYDFVGVVRIRACTRSKDVAFVREVEYSERKT